MLEPETVLTQNSLPLLHRKKPSATQSAGTNSSSVKNDLRSLHPKLWRSGHYELGYKAAVWIADGDGNPIMLAKDASGADIEFDNPDACCQTMSAFATINLSQR